VIDADVESLVGALIDQAERHRLTVMMGRTHGVHAEPLTLGVKLANFVDEVRRSRSGSPQRPPRSRSGRSPARSVRTRAFLPRSRNTCASI